MSLYCGCDLHSNNGVYVIVNEQGKRVFRKRLANDLATVIDSLAPFKAELASVAVESTYNWYWLVDGLTAAGFPLRLANPAKIEQYDGLKYAGDAADAEFLAQLSRLGILPEGYIYPREERPLRDLLRRRMMLVQLRTALILSLQSLVLRQMGRQYACSALARLSRQELGKVLDDDDLLLFTARHQSGIVQILSEKIELFEKEALSRAKLREEYELLLSMPGVGMILGLTIMLETGDVGRFAKVGNFTSYCRCAAAKRVSNGKEKGANNRKNGNKYLSWAFVEAAHHAMRCCPPARSFYQRKAARTNGAVATKALASKWTKAAYWVMKRQEPFDLTRVFG